jgi:hypothetical protein
VLKNLIAVAIGIVDGVGYGENTKALPEQAAGGVVAAEGRLAGRDEVAEALEALQRAIGIVDGVGYGENTKASIITRGLVEMTDFAVAQGAQHETLQGQHAAELGADDVGVHEGAEVRVPGAQRDGFGGLPARRGDDGGRRLLAGDLEGEVGAGRLKAVRPLVSATDAPVVSLMKGVEKRTGLRMSQVIEQELHCDPARIAVASGPNPLLDALHQRDDRSVGG